MAEEKVDYLEFHLVACLVRWMAVWKVVWRVALLAVLMVKMLDILKVEQMVCLWAGMRVDTKEFLMVDMTAEMKVD